jgi:hypothetical protein
MRERLGRLLCRMGLHRWRDGWVAPFSAFRLGAEGCTRCDLVRWFNGFGMTYARAARAPRAPGAPTQTED